MDLASPELEDAIDVVSLLDTLDDPACEWRKVCADEPCGERADWLMLASCGDHAYLCSPHAKRVKADLAKRRSQILTCSRHGGQRVELEWRIVR